MEKKNKNEKSGGFVTHSSEGRVSHGENPKVVLGI